MKLLNKTPKSKDDNPKIVTSHIYKVQQMVLRVRDIYYWAINKAPKEVVVAGSFIIIFIMSVYFIIFVIAGTVLSPSQVASINQTLPLPGLGSPSTSKSSTPSSPNKKSSSSSSNSSGSSSSDGGSGNGATPINGIKPQISGIINQDSSIPTEPGYAQAVHNLTLEIRWSDLQPNPPINGSPAVLVPTNIDNAVASAQANNQRIFLDVQAGQYAPDWVKNLDGPPFQICNDQGQTEKCGTMPRWWDSDFQNDYATLMSELAARYDNVPQIAMVGIAGCMTIYNEPLLREATPLSNIAAYQQAGLNTAGDEQCERAQIDAMQPWVHTESFLSFNPYQMWNGSGFTTNEDFTESLMTYCRQTLGQRCVLGNQSVGNDGSRIAVPASMYGCSDININNPNWESLDPYDRLYADLHCMGPPIEVQSATLIKITAQGVSLTGINGTLASIPWAISYGVGGFQPPVGYDNPSNTNIYLTPTQIETYNSEFAANASP